MEDSVTTIDVSHYMPVAHGTHKDFILPWAREVERLAGGRARVVVHDGDTALGHLINQYAQVANGAVDIAHSPASLPEGRFARSCLLSLPFLCSGAAHGTRVLWSLFRDGLLPEFDTFKVLALHADSGGVLHTRERAVTRLEDLAGLRLRTPTGPMAAALAALGAVPVVLRPPEIRKAVVSGLVDGAVMAWDVVAYTGTAELLPFHCETRLFVSPLYFMMNRGRYEGLPAGVRDAVDAASGDVLVRRFAGWWEAWEAPGRRLADGHAVTQLAEGEIGRWRAVAWPKVAGIVGAEQIIERALEGEPWYFSSSDCE